MENKKITGFIAGNFDLLHPGYIYALEDSKKYCDHLMVFLHHDPSLHKKNKYKPIISLHERYRALMAIRYVDEVFTYQQKMNYII